MAFVCQDDVELRPRQRLQRPCRDVDLWVQQTGAESLDLGVVEDEEVVVGAGAASADRPQEALIRNRLSQRCPHTQAKHCQSD
jgi:hypothetical protein